MSDDENSETEISDQEEDIQIIENSVNNDNVQIDNEPIQNTRSALPKEKFLTGSRGKAPKPKRNPTKSVDAVTIVKELEKKTAKKPKAKIPKYMESVLEELDKQSKSQEERIQKMLVAMEKLTTKKVKKPVEKKTEKKEEKPVEKKEPVLSKEELMRLKMFGKK